MGELPLSLKRQSHPQPHPTQTRYPEPTRREHHILIIYSLLLFTALALSSPWWLIRMLTTDRYREGLAQRLGFVPQALRDYAAGHRILWLHAVSVGEVLAASRLITELEAALNANGGPTCRIVLSTTTKTGQHLARERFGADRVFYMPLDFAFTTRRYLNALNPAALILMESELWPRLLAECNKRNIPVAVVNARMSDRSFARAQKFRSLWARMANRVNLFLAQSEQDATRIATLLNQPRKPATPEAGVPTEPGGPSFPASSERVGSHKAHQATAAQTIPTIPPQILTTGNLKYDIRAPKQSRIAELIQQAARGRKIVVAGSTLEGDPGEDSWLIRACPFGTSTKTPLLVLAPRHPQEFDLVYSMAMEYPTLRATEMLTGKRAEDGFSVRLKEGQTKLVDIILLDTIGDLAAVYGIADIAFVGGSLVPRGGHNPLEPAQFAVPVIMGSSYENFRDIVAKMLDLNGIRIVKDGYELGDTLNYLLVEEDEARALGERGRQVYESQQGATARTVEAIMKLVQR